MRLLVSVIALAVLLGYAFGGRLRRLERLPLRWWGLALAGLGMQFLPLPEGASGNDLLVRTGVLAISYASLLVFALVNVRLAGMPLILLGLASNGLVIVANGGMPVSGRALADSGKPSVVQMLADEGADKHHLMNDEDILTFLADVIPVPGPMYQVMSGGDVFIYAGLVWLTVAAMRGRIPSGSRGLMRFRGKHRRGETVAAAVVLELPPPPNLPPGATRWGSEP
jgi:hypothetical protein